MTYISPFNGFSCVDSLFRSLGLLPPTHQQLTSTETSAMLTSFPILDSVFSNPTESCPTLSSTEFFSLLSDLPTIDSPVIGGQEWKSFFKLVMNEKAIDPDEDLKILINNESQLRMSGYYYGNLTWVDASLLLRRSSVGTFLVRDSEHCSYLYALSVQTKRGPTSCRIDYSNGRFRLDSSEELSHKMPRFDSVSELIDHYVHLTRRLPRKNSPVWLDEENSRDVPVQIYKPLYKGVCSLQHICRVNLIKLQREGHRTNDCLPSTLKVFLKEYPHSQ